MRPLLGVARSTGGAILRLTVFNMSDRLGTQMRTIPTSPSVSATFRTSYSSVCMSAVETEELCTSRPFATIALSMPPAPHLQGHLVVLLKVPHPGILHVRTTSTIEAVLPLAILHMLTRARGMRTQPRRTHRATLDILCTSDFCTRGADGAILRLAVRHIDRAWHVDATHHANLANPDARHLIYTPLVNV